LLVSSVLIVGLECADTNAALRQNGSAKGITVENLCNRLGKRE